MMTIYKAPGAVLEKLNRLLDILKSSKKMFEQTASGLENKQLRNTILGLAQENRQYAEELAAHIQILGGQAGKVEQGAEFKEDWFKEKKEWEVAEDEKTALKNCALREEFTGQQYEDVLNEPFLHENLRKMIHYQFQGLMHSLSQMTLLSTSLAKG
jgi:uncharacterized protein (TIGR02284 family)